METPKVKHDIYWSTSDKERTRCYRKVEVKHGEYLGGEDTRVTRASRYNLRIYPDGSE